MTHRTESGRVVGRESRGDAMSEPDAAARDVLVYMTRWCGACRMAMNWLDDAGVVYRQVDIDEDDAAAERVMSLNRGYRSVPTILVDGEHRLTEPSLGELASIFGG